MKRNDELKALVDQWRVIAHSMRDVVGRQPRVAVSMPVMELRGRAAVYETCADALAALLERNESDEEGGAA